MKLKLAAPALVLASCHLAFFTARAQDTTFTYQGRLNDNGSPASGTYDLRFTIFDSTNNPGIAIAGPLTNAATAASNGLFTVALDFGAVPFDGSARFLEIATRPNGGGAFTVLTPRQPVTATPYATRSLNSGLAASVVAGAINTTSLADGAVTAAKIAPGAVSQLGASDGSPTNAVQVDADGLVGIGTNAPRAGLDVAASGSVVAAQVLFQVQDEMGSYTNLAGIRTLATFSNLVAVGAINDNGVTLLDVSNRQNPSILNQFRDGIGVYTNIAYPYPALKNGLLAIASFNDSAVTLISISNPAAPVKLAELRDGVGGWDGLAGAYAIAISGNLLAVAGFNESAVTLADISNPAAPVLRSIIRDNQFGFNNLATPWSVAISGNILAVGASGDSAVTLINITDPSNPILFSSLQDGVGVYTNLGGVHGVAISGNLLAIAASFENTVTLVDISNPASPAKLAELRSGRNGLLSGVFNVALSSNRLAVSSSVGVTLFDVSTPSFPKLLAEADDGLAGADFLSGATGLIFAGTNVAVAGQSDNGLSLLAFPARPAGIISQGWVGIGTALPQAALDVVGDVVVEQANVFDVNAANIELGLSSVASGLRSVAIGYGNKATGDYSTALGNSTTASGTFSTAAGAGTIASGDYSFAAGRNARATNQGAFVWADSQVANFGSTSNNQFLIRAQGGVGINTNNPGTALDVNGTVTATSFSGNGAALTSLNAGNLTGAIADARLSANVALRGGGNAFTGNQTITGGNVGIGTANPQDALLDVEGATHINDFDLYLRSGTERSHGLGYRASLAGNGGEGPFLYGFNGGALGVGNPDTAILSWSWQGDVSVSNGLSAASITVDRHGVNAGALNPGVVFGGFSGEGIASKRTAAGGNQYGLDFYTASQNRMTINNGGRVGIGTTNPASALHVIGTVTATAFNPPSDRNLKENFKPLDSRQVLEKIVAMPLSEWNFKDDATVRHVGPMAQDFHAAFGLGTDERHIATVDADGVALAAIQGLNEKVESGKRNAENRIEKLEAENAELKRELANITQLLDKLVVTKSQP